MSLSFRKADSSDATDIAALLNKAYRGESSRQGWTTEADLLMGLRTTPEEILDLLTAGHLFLLCCEENRLIGTICLEKQGDTTHLGMFAIEPAMQGQGIGKQLLAYAENTAVETWHTRIIVMSVITLREELIAFYQRRGYQRTGQFKPFPAASKLWQPLVNDLQLELLEKSLQP